MKPSVKPRSVLIALTTRSFWSGSKLTVSNRPRISSGWGKRWGCLVARRYWQGHFPHESSALHGRLRGRRHQSGGYPARVENADLILSLGMFLTDIEMGGSQPPEALRKRCISSVENRVNIGFHTYTNITLRDFVHYLLRADLKRRREKVSYYDNLAGPKKHRRQGILVADVLREINRFLAQPNGFMVVAESGDSLFGGIDIKVGNDGLYLVQGFYASMGLQCRARSVLRSVLGSGH